MIMTHFNVATRKFYIPHVAPIAARVLFLLDRAGLQYWGGFQG